VLKHVSEQEIIKRNKHTGKEISNSFQVNLHVRDFHEILDVGIRLNDGCKDLLRYPRDNTLELVIIYVRSLYNRETQSTPHSHMLQTIIVNVFPEPV